MQKAIKPKKVAIFTRVSTRGQDTARQEDDLQKVARARRFKVVRVIRETISGAASNEAREGVQQLLELARQKAIEKVLVQEVSRLGRSTSEILKVVEELTEQRVSIFVQNFNLETLKPDGSRNPLAQFMFTMLAEFSRMEREHLRERIMSGLERARRNGKKLGRPKGTTLPDDELLKKHGNIVRQLKSGQSIRNTAKICAVSPRTVQKVKNILVEAQPDALPGQAPPSAAD